MCALDNLRTELSTLDRRTVEEIRVKVAKRGKRNVASRLFHVKDDKETIAAWRSDLTRILHVFNVSQIRYF